MRLPESRHFPGARRDHLSGPGAYTPARGVRGVLMRSEPSPDTVESVSEGLSRRHVLGGAGAALAGGLAVGATAGVAAPLAAAANGRTLASGPAGTTAVEFVCRV